MTASGAVFSWGRGTWYVAGGNTERDNGLGHGDRTTQLLPRRVEALAGVEAVHISAGRHFSVVVDAAGTAHACGANQQGKLASKPNGITKLPRKPNSTTCGRKH